VLVDLGPDDGAPELRCANCCSTQRGRSRKAWLIGVRSRPHDAIPAHIARQDIHRPGDWRPQRLVIIEFSERSKAEAFLSASSIQDLFKIRHETTTSKLVLVDGCLQTLRLSCIPLPQRGKANPDGRWSIAATDAVVSSRHVTRNHRRLRVRSRPPRSRCPRRREAARRGRSGDGSRRRSGDASPRHGVRPRERWRPRRGW